MYRLIILLLLLLILPLSNNTDTEKIIRNEKITINIEKEQPIGNIKINKINLDKNFYNITSKKNNIEENITILNGSTSPEIENTTIFLAAHSGPSPIAFFNDLSKLEINDEIILTYNNKVYYYYVKDIWETKKNGSIYLKKENTNQLVLTTCSTTNKDKQLIINSTRKDSIF